MTDETVDVAKVWEYIRAEVRRQRQLAGPGILHADNSVEQLEALKLLPLVPYQRFEPFRGAEPNDAKDPKLPLAKGTGMLGAPSVNG